jgi:homoserine dehydrogenase
VTLAELELAKSLGYRIKLIAQAQRQKDGSLSAAVRPMLLPLAHPLAQISGVYNAIQIMGDRVQDITLVGQGAGEQPTASAVVEDVTNLYRLPYTAQQPTKKAVFAAAEAANGEQFICFTLPESFSTVAQKNLVLQLGKALGDVKNWVSRVQDGQTRFALIVAASQPIAKQQLPTKWREQLSNWQVRPVFAASAAAAEKVLAAVNEAE